MKTLLGAALFALLASACSPKTTSAVRTVDNFGKDGVGLSDNTCGWDITDKRMAKLRAYFSPLSTRVITTDGNLKDTVYAVLANTPRALRMSFFAIEGTTIQVVSDVAKYCSVDTVLNPDKTKPIYVPDQQVKFLQESNRAGTLKELPGCWQTTATTQPRIIIKADAKVIRHHLLRMMAFVYSELLAKNVKLLGAAWVDKAPARVKTFFGDMVIKQAYQRRQMAAAFFKDLANSPAKEQTPAAALADLNAFYSKSYSDFSDYLFAEAVDSYFCSSITYDDFGKNYPLTKKAFVDAQVVYDLTRVGLEDEFASLSSGPKTSKN